MNGCKSDLKGVNVVDIGSAAAMVTVTVVAIGCGAAAVGSERHRVLVGLEDIKLRAQLSVEVRVAVVVSARGGVRISIPIFSRHGNSIECGIAAAVDIAEIHVVAQGLALKVEDLEHAWVK